MKQENQSNANVRVKRWLVGLSIVVGVAWLFAMTLQTLAEPLATIIVTSAADSGAGTLRDALQNAGPNDTIQFSSAVFPPASPATIFLNSELPAIAQNGITIDASNAGVILNGRNLNQTWNDCLIVQGAANITVRGLQIRECPDHGIEVRAGSSNIIIGGNRLTGSGPLGQGNLFAQNGRGVWAEFTSGIILKGNLAGTDQNGTSPQGNDYAGATILNSTDVVVGGSLDGERNLFSGNGDPAASYSYGLEIWRSSDIAIEGNYIGTNLAGTAAIPNAHQGLLMVDSQNVLLKNNLVSGNGDSGIIFDRVHHVTVQGNSIGTNIAGTGVLTNGAIGLRIVGSDFTIGGSNSGEGNLFSGNGQWAALSLEGNGNTLAVIQGNKFGTNGDGTAVLGNLGSGIQISGTNVLLGGSNPGAMNLISGNNGHGVFIESPTSPISVTIMNNRIGTNLAGTGILPNGLYGVIAHDYQEAVVVDNLFSGNGEWAAIALYGNDNSNARIQRNMVGTDKSGAFALSNQGSGIYVSNSNVQLGGSDPADINVVSGNGRYGVFIERTGGGAYTATIQNNRFGTDRAGMTAVSNGSEGVIVKNYDETLVKDNVFGGNGLWSALSLQGHGNSTAVIQGNRVGTNVDGTSPIRNLGTGIYITGTNVLLGGASPDDMNVISGNGLHGVLIESDVTHPYTATVLNNRIGSDIYGTDVITNAYEGVFIQNFTYAVVQGNVLSGNGRWAALSLTGRGNSEATVQNNMIGTDVTGSVLLGNINSGIYITGTNILLGGDAAGQRNVVAGSGSQGIHIESAVPNTLSATIVHNVVGLDLSGTSAFPNTYNGILVIGVKDVEIRDNLVSSNQENGISIEGRGVTTAYVCGNNIGTNGSGNTALGNGGNGIYATQAKMFVGVTGSCAGNLISGNAYAGISLQSSENQQAVIQGNMIGTDATGEIDLGQRYDGVWVSGVDLLFGGPNAQDGNLVSGNGSTGLVIENASGALVQNNLFGTNRGGVTAIPNGYHGVFLTNSHASTIQDNILSGNDFDGLVMGASSSENQVFDNMIGADVTGLYPLGNAERGIGLWGGAHHNNIYNNLISGNGAGIVLHDQGTDFNHVYGNIIGSDATGLNRMSNKGVGIAISNGANNMIGGSTADERNLISGNDDMGVSISGLYATQNVVVGNYIGVDISATFPISNYAGIGVFSQAHETQIGGPAPGERNIVSGNEREGINVSSYENQVVNNYVGSDATGSVAIGNGTTGIVLYSSVTENVLGGQNLVLNNLVVGSGQHPDGGSGIGISSSDNVVQGNRIGVDATGHYALPNRFEGISIGGGSRNMIGGDDPLQRNLISGNEKSGIAIWYNVTEGVGSANNIIQGNYIGTDVAGSFAIGNGGAGIFVSGHANIVGGSLPGEGNLVSASGENGIVLGLAEGISATQNIIQGNYVGTDATGQIAIPNGDSGIALWDGVEHNLVGGDVPEAGNLVAFNRDFGLFAGQGVGNSFAYNVVHDNQNTAVRVTVNTRLVNNDVFNNGINRIEMPAEPIVSANQVWAPQGDANTFYLYYKCSTCELEIPSDRTLTLAAGTILRLDFNRQIQVNGTFDIEGNALDPVIVTGPRDSIWAGDWDGINFEPGSQGTINYATISYAKTGLTIAGDVSLSHSVVAANQTDGLRVSGNGVMILEDNTFGDNQRYDINNQTTRVLNAQSSWWGTASGADPNTISGSVDTSNWRQNESNNNDWFTADFLLPGTHQFEISSYNDFDWYRIPIMEADRRVAITIKDLPADYDAFLFAQLNSIPEQGIQDLGAMMNLDVLQATGGLQSIPRLMKIAQVFSENNQSVDTGQLVGASTNVKTESEEIVFFTGNQVGWYYLLVVGNNGANRPHVPYTIDLGISYALGNLESYYVPTFSPITATLSSETLIIVHKRLLEEQYGAESTALLMGKLDELANHPDVQGDVIDLSEFDLIESKYISWTQESTSVYKANLVAATIKSLLTAVRTSYPNLKYIVLVGNDAIIPHWRTFDESTIAKESDYTSNTLPDSPMGIALAEGFFFTDDFYGDFEPQGWRGRQLFLPQYAVGRLVETPADMISIVDAFLANSPTTITSALVTGYDFLIDQATSVRAELGGVTVTTLISNYWSSQDLRNAWFLSQPVFSSLNAHFSHWEAVPANFDQNDLFTPIDIQNGLFDSEGSLVYSVGCHSGLCIPDEQSLPNYALDFCQVLAGKGMTYIGNTGYGFGDDGSIGYSEWLSVLFIRNLRQGTTVGEALIEAKRAYYATAGSHSFSPYDEKVMTQVTLYGLPMYRYEFPIDTQALSRLQETNNICTVGVPLTQENGLMTRQVACDIPVIITSTVKGNYYSIFEETEINMGQPIQPRTSVPISTTGNVAHGVVFEGGEYTTITEFDPVVTQVITDGTSIYGEPPIVTSGWLPSRWDAINSIRTKNGWYQNLVLIPAQYQSVSPTQGIERVFEVITYTAYYSSSADQLSPVVWTITAWKEDGQIDFSVETTDFSGIERVVIAYNLNDGYWSSLDLVVDQDNQNNWTGSLLATDYVEFFVQAVDRAGNVTVDDNKGVYYHQAVKQNTYLPVISAGTAAFISSSSNEGVFEVRSFWLPTRWIDIITANWFIRE